MDQMGMMSSMMGGGQPPGGQQPPMQQGPNPQDILQQMLGQQFPPLPGKVKKPKKPGMGKNENKNTTPGTPQGKLQKARDLIKAVVNELGAQSEIASALSGQVRNLDMQIKKLGGMEASEEQITGKGDMGPAPLGIGAPGTLPPGGGSGVMGGPMNPDTLNQNMQGGTQ